jgi:hypothetical protein
MFSCVTLDMKKGFGTDNPTLRQCQIQVRRFGVSRMIVLKRIPQRSTTSLSSIGLNLRHKDMNSIGYSARVFPKRI